MTVDLPARVQLSLLSCSCCTWLGEGASRARGLYLFLQKQNRSRVEIHIYLEEGTYHKRLEGLDHADSRCKLLLDDVTLCAGGTDIVGLLQCRGRESSWQ
jgi:hypothetical protein